MALDPLAVHCEQPPSVEAGPLQHQTERPTVELTDEEYTVHPDRHNDCSDPAEPDVGRCFGGAGPGAFRRSAEWPATDCLGSGAPRRERGRPPPPGRTTAGTCRSGRAVPAVCCVRPGPGHPLVDRPVGQAPRIRDPDVAEEGEQLRPVLVGRLGVGIAAGEPIDQRPQGGPFVLVSDLAQSWTRQLVCIDRSGGFSPVSDTSKDGFALVNGLREVAGG